MIAKSSQVLRRKVGNNLKKKKFLHIQHIMSMVIKSYYLNLALLLEFNEANWKKYINLKKTSSNDKQKTSSGKSSVEEIPS